LPKAQPDDKHHWLILESVAPKAQLVIIEDQIQMGKTVKIQGTAAPMKWDLDEVEFQLMLSKDTLTTITS